MTVKQKQWQLYYLGFYGDSLDDIDGEWGSQSVAATKALQSSFGLTADGVFGSQTEAKAIAIIKDIQTALANAGVVDGLAGLKTLAATKSYQQKIGLPATGIADENTRSTLLDNAASSVASKDMINESSDDWWDDIEFFDREEFRCKCGGKYCNGYPVEPDRKLIEIADGVRRYFEKPATVSSGIRCKQHNANEGGVVNSRHVSGKAMDFCIAGKTSSQVLAYVKTISGIRYSYAINDKYVHMDVL